MYIFFIFLIFFNFFLKKKVVLVQIYSKYRDRLAIVERTKNYNFL